MKREEFLKAVGALGVCSCAGAVPLLPAEDDEIDDLKRKKEFMIRRMADLVAGLDPETRSRTLETMGRACARRYAALTDRFKGDPKGFLEEIKKQWADTAEYDEPAGVVNVVDRSTSCTCAFVKPGVTPPEFCECTLGWQKEAYGAVFGKPVEVELVESILRGGTRCAFRIRVVSQEAPGL